MVFFSLLPYTTIFDAIGANSRIRFSVRRRRVCPGEEKRILRKSALCADALTKKRTLTHHPHGKAHPALTPVAKLRFSVRVLRKGGSCADCWCHGPL